jgi:hypothetical protein
MLAGDLQNYHQQFQSIKADARDLLGDLSESQFNWRPTPNQWSIAQCVDHLLVTGNNSLSHTRVAIEEARSNGLFARGPFRYRLIDRWFVRQMEPRARMRFKAPKAYLPSSGSLSVEIMAAFYALQDDFIKCLEEADGLDLSRTRVNNPVSRWFRLSLGQELAFNAAHERRHLWQAGRVKQSKGFPGPTAV